MAASTYSSESDLNLDATRLVELTESPSAIGVKDQTLLDALSLDAQGLIDGVLYGKYVLPFNPVPVAIKYLHADEWRYLLFKHRDSLNIPDEVKESHKQALADLAEYASAGGRLLPSALVSAASGPTPGYGSFSSDVDDTNPAVRIFGRHRDGLG